MKNKTTVTIVIVIIVIALMIFGFGFFVWYATYSGEDYFAFRSHGIELNKVYSGEDFSSPAKVFRNLVIMKVEKHVFVPENYDFYFTEKLNAHEMYYSRFYNMYMNWTDENNFSHNIFVETYDGKLRGFAVIRSDIYKKGVVSPLTFKDYVSDEEPEFVKDIREQVKLVIKNPETTLVEMTIPHVEIVKRPIGDENKEIIMAKVILSKDSEGNYLHEYDYNGDGVLDESKTSKTIQASKEELADVLGLSHSVVELSPGQSRWKIHPDEKYKYIPRSFVSITRLTFDDPGPGGQFRENAVIVEINIETEVMHIRIFA